jgi:hypothetical protein
LQKSSDSGKRRGLEVRKCLKLCLSKPILSLLSAKQVHQFTAVTAIEIYDFSDAPFDLHYVAATRKEISYRAALARKRTE